MALQESLEKQGNFLFRYRSYLPLIILIVGLFVFALDVLNEELPTWIPYHCIEYSALLVSFFGLGIRIIAVGHTPANTSGRNTKTQLADEINQTGIYSTVRHPLYLGNFFMWLGTVMLIGNGWFLIVFSLAYWIYYERIMYAEEQFLRKKFGQPYLDWADKTPAFIPSCKNRIPSIYPFSFKKILKKEKNGVLAIFVLLFLFHNLKFSLDRGEAGIQMDWIAIATIISFIVYYILKVIKRKTNWLDEGGR
jgi:protein-S-isoprenylcysteine O-methyltransferase Ste14